MGQLAWLEWYNEWKEGLGRQRGAFAQEWLECMKLSFGAGDETVTTDG